MRRHWRTQTELLFQEPLAHHRYTIAPIKIKEPHNHGPRRATTRTYARLESWCDEARNCGLSLGHVEKGRLELLYLMEEIALRIRSIGSRHYKRRPTLR